MNERTNQACTKPGTLREGSRSGRPSLTAPRTDPYAKYYLIRLLLLIYVPAEEPTLSTPHWADVFSDVAVHWLYDEVDATDGGVFSHDVLLSNGRTLSVKFVTFDMMTVRKKDFDISRRDQIAAAAP